MTRNIYAVAILISLLNISSCINRDITDEEKAHLITVNDFDFLGINVACSDRYEQYNARQNLDGTLELEYEFQPEKPFSHQDIIWLKTEIEFCNTPTQAKISFHERISAYKLGMAISDRSLVLELSPQLVLWGNDNYSAFLKRNGNILGNVIVVRLNDRIISMILLGVYFEDPELIYELFSQKLELPPWNFEKNTLQKI
ncbi:hypothetical protein JW979_13330 [bacterium]|nr:hypothetical protein [candidate division CSSED10-310 bacterium]